jgi:hypothetical protein
MRECVGQLPTMSLEELNEFVDAAQDSVDQLWTEQYPESRMRQLLQCIGQYMLVDEFMR